MSIFSQPLTLKDRGYHMTEEDVQAEQDKALGQYTRSKTNLAAARERLNMAGKQMSAIGQELQSKSAEQWIEFQFEKHSWLDEGGIKALIGDVIRAHDEVNKAKSKATSLGVALHGE